MEKRSRRPDAPPLAHATVRTATSSPSRRCLSLGWSVTLQRLPGRPGVWYRQRKEDTIADKAVLRKAAVNGDSKAKNPEEKRHETS
jgi:hypothetical protein